MLVLWFVGQCLWAQALPQSISGVVLDEKDQAVAGATVTARSGPRSIETQTDAQGHFSLQAPAGRVTLQVSGKYIAHQERMLEAADPRQKVELHIHYSIALVDDSIVITATTLDPIDRRNDAIYKNTLFSRDDQIFDTLAAGINAGQHEGGGKSLEIRRFGFNLDHGGVNGGLKVLVDDVQQNQATQGHGQGYLGALKSLTPETGAGCGHPQWSFQR